MHTLAAFFALDPPAPAPRRPVPRPVLIGDISTARGGVPELLIQMARSEDREDPEPQP